MPTMYVANMNLYCNLKCRFAAVELYIQELFAYSHGIQCAREASENVSSMLVCFVLIF